jgi:MFS family permease
MIFLSRIIDGMLGSNFTIAQAYLSDISSKKDRSKVFALTGVAFGIGFFIGPAIGGFFSRFGYSIPSFIAAGIAGLTILLTYFYLPETVERQARTFKVKIVDLNAFKKYFKLPKISMRLWEFLAYISAMMLWTSSIALFTDMQLGFSAEQVGYLLGYVGLISIFLRGFLIPRLIDKYGEDKLIINGFYTMVLGLVFASISSNIWLFLIGTSLFAYGAGVLRPLLMGSISRAASSKEQGAVMGVANSLASLAQIYGPLIGGYILTYYKPTYLGLLAAMVMTGGLIMVIKERRLLAINS